MSDNEREPLPLEPRDADDDAAEDAPFALPDDAADVDAALAALAELPALAQDDAPAEDAVPPADIAAVPAPPSDFLLPPLSALSRGQAASFLPAFALMAAGMGLTFALTGGTLTLTPALLLAFGTAGMGTLLLAHWLSSGRWSTGNFFLGLLLLLWGVLGTLLLTGGTLTLYSGYPLFAAALGMAVLLASWFGDATRSVPLLGAGLLLGGLVALAQTLGVLPFDLFGALAPLSLPLLVACLLLLFLPRLGRTRR